MFWSHPNNLPFFFLQYLVLFKSFPDAGIQIEEISNSLLISIIVDINTIFIIISKNLFNASPDARILTKLTNKFLITFV